MLLLLPLLSVGEVVVCGVVVVAAVVGGGVAVAVVVVAVCVVVDVAVGVVVKSIVTLTIIRLRGQIKVPPTRSPCFGQRGNVVRDHASIRETAIFWQWGNPRGAELGSAAGLTSSSFLLIVFILHVEIRSSNLNIQVVYVGAFCEMRTVVPDFSEM